MKRYLGFGAIITTAVIYGCMPITALHIYESGCNAVALSFLRTAFACPFLFLIAKKYTSSIKNHSVAKLGVGAGVGLASTTLLLFSSYQFIPSGTATILHFVYPVIVTIGGPLVLHSRVTKKQILCTCLCLVGICLSYSFQGGGETRGYFLAILSGVTNASYLLYLERLQISKSDQLWLAFYSTVSSAIMILVFILVTGQATFPQTILGWVSIMIFGVITSGVATILVQLGVRLIGAQNASILSTFEPITSVILGIVFLSEPVSLRTLFSCVFVLTAVVVLAFSKCAKS